MWFEVSAINFGTQKVSHSFLNCLCVCIVDTFFRLFHLFGLYFDSREYLSIILTICMKSKYTNEKKMKKKFELISSKEL